MKFKSLFSFVFVSILSIALSGCSKSNPSGPSGEDKRMGYVNTQVDLQRVGVLSKTSSINLSKLILTAVSTSSPSDTVRDTTTVSGNAQLTVNRVLTLKPLRNWSISAKTLDLRDSVIHQGTTSSFFVKPADTAFVNLTLNSRFTMYEANFLTLPDSISSSVSGTGKDILKVNHVLVKVDGTNRADSTVSPSFFSAGQSVKVTYDYVTVGSHTLLLEVYGVMNNYTGILYSGTVVVNVAAGIDDTQAFNLTWVGPTTGNGKLTVVIGKVGKAVLNGSLPGSVIP